MNQGSIESNDARSKVGIAQRGTKPCIVFDDGESISTIETKRGIWIGGQLSVFLRGDSQSDPIL
ncbi:MAG: hypothetical protein FJ219_05980 [Ignavibacteria bacterium]|nr:hypothetical protein [Ignavibacteria bacterium]